MKEATHLPSSTKPPSLKRFLEGSLKNFSMACNTNLPLFKPVFFFSVSQFCKTSEFSEATGRLIHNVHNPTITMEVIQLHPPLRVWCNTSGFLGRCWEPQWWSLTQAYQPTQVPTNAVFATVLPSLLYLLSFLLHILCLWPTPWTVSTDLGPKKPSWFFLLGWIAPDHWVLNLSWPSIPQCVYLSPCHPQGKCEKGTNFSTHKPSSERLYLLQIKIQRERSRRQVGRRE